MRHSIVLMSVLLMAPATASADALTTLRTRLEGLIATQPVQARLEITRQTRNGDEAAPPPSTVQVDAEVDGSGLRLGWPRELLDAARRERLQEDPEAQRVVANALSRISATDVDGYLDAAPELLSVLRGASLESETEAEWDGSPARLLTLSLEPQLSERDRKYIKNVEGSAKIWLDAEGLPLAAERSMRIAGRAMLVISFESSEEEYYTFARRGDRLVVLSHRSESKSAGAGERGEQSVRTNLTLGGP